MTNPPLPQLLRLHIEGRPSLRQATRAALAGIIQCFESEPVASAVFAAVKKLADAWTGVASDKQLSWALLAARMEIGRQDDLAGWLLQLGEYFHQQVDEKLIEVGLHGLPGRGPGRLATATATREALTQYATAWKLPGDEEDARPAAKTTVIELIAGHMAFRGVEKKLIGQPRRMLKELLSSRHYCCSADHLERILADSAYTDNPRKVVIDTAKQLRAAIKELLQAALHPCDNPLPSVGSGEDLAYQLKILP